MTSFNHYALGAVADWMHRIIGGIAPAEPGYRRITIAPRPGGGLTWAKASLMTPQGQVAIAWEFADQLMSVEIVIPAGCRADVDLPGSSVVTVQDGRHTFVARLDPERQAPAVSLSGRIDQQSVASA